LLRLVVWYKFTDVSEVLDASIIALMLEAANTSEISAAFYKTTTRNNPEDSHLQILGQYLKLGHSNFLLHIFQFVVH
jgi:hypothetical protein